MEPLPDQRRSPRESVFIAAELFGHDAMIHWGEELLAGRALDIDSRYPDIAWLRGTVGWPVYWSRVWGARALLHLGPPARPGLVLAALDDPAWRVREMSLKVIAAHDIADPEGLVDPLVEDPIERVRHQAWRALGLRKEPGR